VRVLAFDKKATLGFSVGERSMMWIIDAWLLMAALCLHWIEEAEEGPWN
jgi:hypothetical protein